MNEKIKAISKFFDDHGKALELLKEVSTGTTIKMDDESECCIEFFYDRHKVAFQRRIKHNIKHSIEILENELKKSSGPGVSHL